MNNRIKAFEKWEKVKSEIFCYVCRIGGLGYSGAVLKAEEGEGDLFHGRITALLQTMRKMEFWREKNNKLSKVQEEWLKHKV